MAYIMTGELWRDPAILLPPTMRHSGGIPPEWPAGAGTGAALKNVHDEVRQARHFERMQEMNLFSGEKAR